MEIPVLSADDKARLMLNLPTLANRWVEFAGKTYPIMHLGIGDLEQFRAAIAPIEKFYLEFSKTELPFAYFVKVYAKEVFDLFVNRVPKAAAIVLGTTEQAVIASCCPVGAFSVILAQWLHNQEIGALQGLFPSPDSEEDSDLAGDPSSDNPMSIIQKMASAYHWPESEILKLTVPKIYLMGNDAAWGYAKIKQDSPDGRSASKNMPIVVDGKKRKNFKGMNSHEYRKYLEQVFGGMEIPAIATVNT